jgi:two-component system response regulator BaeR
MLVLNTEPEAADLIVLDVMLPGKDGFTLCRDIRAFSAVPILMVTARAEEIDRLLGLEFGADDYILKPFSPREVVARVKAVLRRSGAAPVAAALVLDPSRLAFTWRGKAVVFTAIEFQLLQCVASAPGRIWSREQLMERIYPDHRVVSDRTIDSHVKKLRRRLEEAFPGSNLVQSVYGAGYRFELPD